MKHTRNLTRLLRCGMLIFLALVAGAALFARNWLQPPLLHQPVVSVSALGADASGKRSDFIAVAFVSTQTGRVALLRCPRDLWVQKSGGGRTRVNALPPARLFAWLQTNLGGRLDRNVRLTLDGTARLIDAVGGAEVNVPENMNYDDAWGHLHIHLKSGWQHLNGAEMLAALRFRHRNRGPNHSDLWRVRHQAALEEALMTSMRAMIWHPTAQLRLKRVWETQVDTDLTTRETAALAWRLREAQRNGTLRQMTLPCSTDGNGLVLDNAELKFQMALMRRWLSGAQDLVGIRVVCAGSAQEAHLSARLKQAGLFPVIAVDPAMPENSSYLVAPIGQGKALAAKLAQQGLCVRVHEAWRTHAILIYGKR